MREYPRLGNYPNEASKEEIVAYLEKLINWCVEAELKLKYYEREP